MTTQLRFGLFVLLALLQLSFPAKLVFDSNKVLWMGTELKFETRPVDPADPFRGRYVALNFAANQFEEKSASSWKRNDPVFVLLDQDAQGFARIKGLSAVRPAAERTFCQSYRSLTFMAIKSLFIIPLANSSWKKVRRPKQKRFTAKLGRVML